MIGWLNKLHHWSWIWLDGSCWIIIFRRKCSLHICELGLKDECLKSDRLVCEKNATKAQPVTNCNFGSINSVNFNYEMNLSIVRGRIFVTINYVRLYKCQDHSNVNVISKSNVSVLILSLFASRTWVLEWKALLLDIKSEAVNSASFVHNIHCSLLQSTH